MCVLGGFLSHTSNCIVGEAIAGDGERHCDVLSMEQGLWLCSWGLHAGFRVFLLFLNSVLQKIPRLALGIVPLTRISLTKSCCSGCDSYFFKGNGGVFCQHLSRAAYESEVCLSAGCFMH